VSEDHVEIVRRSNAAFKRRDRDATFADFDPDVELRDLMNAPDTPELIRGISALRATWDTWEQVFDDFTIEIDEYVDVGDCVLAVTHWRGKSKDSGLAIDQKTVDAYEFADGKIVRVTLSYPNMDAALKDVGLEE
jgi:ketosteroid isomerase-like protein